MSTATLHSERRISQRPPLLRDPSRPAFPFQRAVCVLSLFVSDLLAIAISLRLATFVRAAYLPLVDARISPYTLSFRHYLEFAWVWLPVVVFLAIEGLYTQRRTLWNEIAHLTKAVTLGLITVFAAIALVQRTTVVSRLTVILTALFLLAVMPAVRYWTKRMLGALGVWRKKILILGSGSTAKLAMRGLTADPVLGYEIAGLLDDDPAKEGQCVAICAGKPVYILGGTSDALRELNATRAKDILIAMPEMDEDRLLSIVHELQEHCESIYLVPQLWCLPLMNLRVDGFLRERLMMLKLSNNLAKPWNVWIKRSFDLILGSLIGLALFPLCLFLAVIIKMDSPGPALFVQERLGFRGNRFRCIKFRTMHVQGEEMLIRHLERNPNAAEEWQTYAKLRVHDPRLTRVGRLLRRFSLDEVPQLWNVLRGEMSLVGPRPYLVKERDRMGTDMVTILLARPGMTGFWQVSGRNELTFDDRVQLEAWYVRNWTIWFDCIILAKTFRTVLFSDDSQPSDLVVPYPEPSVPPEVVRNIAARQHDVSEPAAVAARHGD
jgi:Undecaprenyl-phosphate galactose phosphotransferase WbaP